MTSTTIARNVVAELVNIHGQEVKFEDMESNRNKGLAVPLAGGDDVLFAPLIKFKKDVDVKVRNNTNLLCAEVVAAYNNVVRGYFELVPAVSKMIGNKTWENMLTSKGETIKGINGLIIELTSCSKATASEIAKVARTFYSNGELLNEGCKKLTYSELVKIASEEKDVRDNVIDDIKDKHSRKEVIDLIAHYRAKRIEEQNKQAGMDTDENGESSKSAINSGEVATEIVGESSIDEQVHVGAGAKTGDNFEDASDYFGKVADFVHYITEQITTISNMKQSEMKNALRVLQSEIATKYKEL